MNRLELDKWDLKRLHELKEKGRLNLQPEYQRGKVWDDARRYDLIDTVLRNWPMGLVMVRVEETQDADKVPTEEYDVVDGQQRLTTLFEYREGKESWALKAPPKIKDFRPYTRLSQAQQTRVDEYKVALALMRDYEPPEIQDVYSRLQTGKPLKIGERIKALRSPFKDHIKVLAGHKLFELARHRWRDSNWNLAGQFFKAAYSDDPLARVEFNDLKVFLEGAIDEQKAQKARERASKIMNFELKTLKETIDADQRFEDVVGSARTLKWLYAALMPLLDKYALSGREHLVGKGLLSYHQARTQSGSPEWQAYYETGRTGRMDTDDVRLCLNQLSSFIVNAADAEPTDTTRSFSAAQRSRIWQKSGGKCQACGIPLSITNFHADHIRPFRDGGPTTVENGQALCAACNLKKGGGLFSEAY